MTDQLSISVSAWSSHVLVSLAGECDTTTALHLLEALTTQIPRDARRVVIDLSALRFIDAAGIHVLLSVRRALASHSGSLTVAAPQPIVARVLELTGARQLIPVFERLAEALPPDR